MVDTHGICKLLFVYLLFFMFCCFYLFVVVWGYHATDIMVLQCSLRPKPVATADIIATKHILIQHQQRMIKAKDEEDYQRLYVRRSRVYSDAMRSFGKPSFDVEKMLKVSFIGEEAVDDGGPRREFFNLLIKNIFTSSGLFCGWPDHIVPLHNIPAITSNNFFIIGKMIATCLVQGGEPPVCFAHAIADYLVFDRIKSTTCVEDIPDPDIKSKMEKASIYFSTVVFLCHRETIQLTLLTTKCICITVRDPSQCVYV